MATHWGPMYTQLNRRTKSKPL